MRQIARISLFCVSVVMAHAAPGECAVATEVFSYYHENVLGTSLELRVHATGEAAARGAESRALAEIDRLEKIFSGYDPTSEFSRWSNGSHATQKISPELHEVLAAAEDWRIKSAGAFDVRAEVFSRLWTECAQQNRLPTAEESTDAIAVLKPPAWSLGPVPLTAARLSDAPISLNGIAKGYIVERACEAVMRQSAEIRGVLLNIGGDLRVFGDLPGTIAIVSPWADSESSEPYARIRVRGQSVATSGRSQRGFRINGKWHSHVFDPRTGRPVDRVLSATVIADRGIDADALAKICSVLEPEESLRLVNRLDGVDCLILSADGRTTRSSGWAKREEPIPVAIALGAAHEPGPADTPKTKAAAKAETKPTARPAWSKDFEFVINLEINHPEAEKGRYRRPYVAVWVEDETGKQLRTLALWVSMGGSGPFQWLPDLKRWYKSEEDRKLVERKDIFFTVSRPTRPPGKYRVIWDGKDNQGNQLPGGDYTITIEAAREHGTYQSIRRDVSLTNKPFSEDLKGNVEIRAASIEYRRKTAPK